MSRPNAPTATTTADHAPPDLFNALRDILQRHRDALQVVHDDAGHFYANSHKADAKGKAQFLGAVKVSGRRHAFHFMPVYDFPDLLDGISPALKKHMQGKSCFNFNAGDAALLAELQALVDRGVARYEKAGKL